MRRVGYRCTACGKMFLKRHYEYEGLRKALEDAEAHARDNCMSFADYKTII